MESENVVNVESLFDPLKIKAQEDGFSGSEFPSSRYVNPETLFLKTDKKENTLYGVISDYTFLNEFDACIKFKQGHFKWVEIIYDKNTKKRSKGKVVENSNNIIEYPDGVLSDIHDLSINIYLKFDINGQSSKEFFSLIQHCNDVKYFINILEEFTKCKCSKEFIETINNNENGTFLKIIENLKSIVFYNWIETDNFLL